MKGHFPYSLLLVFLVASCLPSHQNLKKSTYNKGGYTISKLKNTLLHDQDYVVLFGSIKNNETNLPLGLGVSNIKYGCLTYSSDANGNYIFRSKISTSDVFLTCLAIGYRTIETEPFELQGGDSIRINFILALDDRPLINCEGIGNKE